MTEEYFNACQRTLDNLKHAKQCLQQVRNYLNTAKSFHVLSGAERKAIDNVQIDLLEPIDNIESVAKRFYYIKDDYNKNE